MCKSFSTWHLEVEWRLEDVKIESLGGKNVIETPEPEQKVASRDLSFENPRKT